MCDCVENAAWDSETMICGCSSGFYADGNECKDCSAITVSDDPFIELTNPEHIDGTCDCTGTAGWNSETNACVNCNNG